MALERLDVRELLKNTSKLPTLPAVALEIVRVSNDPKTGAEDLSKLLSTDMSLSAKVLRMVNSSYYGSRKEVTSVKQAVVILGFETVRSLSLSTAIMDKFAHADRDVEAARNEFWKHSLGVAMTCRVIARHLKEGKDAQETYYMAGLLHDIGKVILDQYFHENFEEITRRVKSQGVSFYEAEKGVNSISHDEIGAFLGQQWGLPKPIINSIRFHHAPMAAEEDHRIVDATHFADILTKTKGMGSGGDDDITGLSEASVARLALPDESVGVIVEVEMQREFEGAKELLALLD